MFPIVFVTFHLMYWTTLITISSPDVTEIIPLSVK
jgi:hypothetical protein